MGSEYDVVVIGGGLAGLTAGLFAARHGLGTLVVEASAPGGHLVNVEKIEDFPGFPDGVAGYDLGPMVQEQAANWGAEFRLAEVERLAPLDSSWLVGTSDGEFRAKTVIVAAGARPKALGVPGEARLLGRGVSHCASCDGPLFRGRVVGVAGGGDSALQETLTLASHASRVVLFQRGQAFSAQDTYQRRVCELGNVEIRFGTRVVEILGEDSVVAVRIRNETTSVEETVALSGVFVYVGLRPNAELLGGVVELDRGGHVPADIWMHTRRRGLFAVGDIRQSAVGQAITAAGDGATAAIAAFRYLSGQPWPVTS